MKNFPKGIDSKYQFVTVAAKRCEMLQKGARPKINAENYLKSSTIAIHEVLDGLVEFEANEPEPTGAESKA